MSDTRETGTSADVIEIAEEYRQNLIAEIERIDALLDTASGVYVDERGEAHLFAVRPILGSTLLH
jgi:hypothetical protein